MIEGPGSLNNWNTLFWKQIIWLGVANGECMWAGSATSLHYDTSWFKSLLVTSPAPCRSPRSSIAPSSGKSDPRCSNQHGQGVGGQSQSGAAASGIASTRSDLFARSFVQHARPSWNHKVQLCPAVNSQSVCGLFCPSASLPLRDSGQETSTVHQPIFYGPIHMASCSPTWQGKNRSSSNLLIINLPMQKMLRISQWTGLKKIWRFAYITNANIKFAGVSYVRTERDNVENDVIKRSSKVLSKDT